MLLTAGSGAAGGAGGAGGSLVSAAAACAGVFVPELVALEASWAWRGMHAITAARTPPVTPARVQARITGTP